MATRAAISRASRARRRSPCRRRRRAVARCRCRSMRCRASTTASWRSAAMACACSAGRRRVQCSPPAVPCLRWPMRPRSTAPTRAGTSTPRSVAAPCTYAPQRRTSASRCSCSWTSPSPQRPLTMPTRPHRCWAANCRPTACWWSTDRPKNPAMRWKMPSTMIRPRGSAACATRPCAPVPMSG
ncbi:hypothetical protein D3C73_1138510 [compost metagenome]